MDARKPVTTSAALLNGPLALYVHIPFCETKCPYCDFNTYAGIEPLIPEYISALEREVRTWGNLLDHPANGSIFFGGGTPSYIPSDDIHRLISAARDSFRVSDRAEVTIESNPGDIDEAKLAAYLNAGVNRISIGVQSLDDDLLSLLGRKHDSDTAIDSVNSARRVGFGNLSFDLMFGLPYQTMDQWRETLARSIDLSSQHLSLYSLTLEPNTPLEAAVRRGELPEPDPDLAADMYLVACEQLESAGYQHYEISNWTQPGFESRHNLAYWLSQPYLGVGPGAHSYLQSESGSFRFENVKSPREYVRSVPYPSPVDGVSAAIRTMERDGPISSVEDSLVRQEISDFLMMGLRLQSGISRASFETRFGVDITTQKCEVLADLASSGLIEFDDDVIRIPHKQWLIGNEVFLRLVDNVESKTGKAACS